MITLLYINLYALFLSLSRKLGQWKVSECFCKVSMKEETDVSSVKFDKEASTSALQPLLVKTCYLPTLT